MAISKPTESFLPSEVASSQFTLQSDHSLFTVLRKNIYSDPMLAGIRELSTNAVDACLEADLPVNWEVHIPTIEEPHFAIRDFGPGMTIDFLSGDFTVVGASSKRNSNRTNGQFGLGRLSPLAYTSSFTIESWNSGMYYSYLVSLSDGIPSSVQLASSPSSEPSGCRFTFQVAIDDIRTFHQKAANLYKYFEHKPNSINIELPEVHISLDTDHCMLTDDRPGVVMANVYYPLDYRHATTNYEGLILKVPTGSVSLTPGRESLNYDPETIQYLSDFIKLCEEELIDISNTYIAEAPTAWEQVVRYKSIEDKTPYRLKPKLKMSSNYTYLAPANYNPFTLPNCDYMMSHPNYSKAMNANRFYGNAFNFLYSSSDAILLVDNRTYTHIYNEYDRLFIIKPDKDAIEFTKQILDFYGVSYKLSSSFPTPERNSTSSAPKALALRPVNGYGVLDYTADMGTIYYVPYSGTDIKGGFSEAEFIHFLRYIGFTDDVYGIAASNLSKVKNNSLFINLYDHLKEQHENKSIIIYTKPKNTFDEWYYFRGRNSSILESPNNPLEDLRTCVYQHNKLQTLAEKSFSDTLITFMSDYLNIQQIPYRLTYSLKDMLDKYPLLREVNNTTKDVIHHYLKLEHHYASTSPNSSG